MNNTTFNDLLTEYQSIGIGPLIYSLVSEIVSAITRHYPPSFYSVNRVWDEDANTGICNDFILNKLLKRGWLDAYFLSLDSIEGLQRVLKRDFRHYLISKKIRTEKGNIYLRVKRILKSNPGFQVASESAANGSLWGLNGWAAKKVAQDPHDVMKVIEAIQLPPLIRYRLDSMKISPLIGNPALLRLIEETFQTLDMRISLGVLVDAICNRLGVLSDDVLSLENSTIDDDQTLADIIPNSDIYVETEVSCKQIAEEILDRLSDRQRKILELQFELENPTLVEIGEELGISKSTVGNEIVVIERIIKESQPSSLEIDLVINYLKEHLSKNKTAHWANSNS